MNLIKNYDLTLEGPGLANVAAAIATGPAVAGGDNFKEVVLERRVRVNNNSERSKEKPSWSSQIQASFPSNNSEKMATSILPKRKIKPIEESLSELPGKEARPECDFDLRFRFNC